MTGAAPLVLSQDANVALLGAELVANRLRARPELRLILPTGHTPRGMYAALRAHAAEGSLPSERATLFQLDEYLGIGPDDPRSYRAYLARELGDIGFGTFRSLDGATDDPAVESARHQAGLDEAPIDLVVLGIGRDGHIAFDEPGSPIDSGTRRVCLHEATRADAAADFGGIDAVPTEALTVGLRTLKSAREIILLVSGEAKAPALAAALEGEPGPECPASLIRDHPRLTVIADVKAAARLRPHAGRTSDRAVIILGHRDRGSTEDRISDESRARIARGVAVCRPDPPRAVILTGYTRTYQGLSEAEQMKAVWPLDDVPALLEDAGRNTAENATRSLPLIRAIADVRRVTVVTSIWHVRTPYFFAPYRTLGLRLSFAVERSGPWLRPLLGELAAARSMRDDRRAAMAAMRLPASAAQPGGEESSARPCGSSG
jgi:glucosamine-6-phosphate deaminase